MTARAAVAASFAGAAALVAIGRPDVGCIAVVWAATFAVVYAVGALAPLDKEEA